LLWGVTAQYPTFSVTGSGGATVPMIHLELQSKAAEAGAGIGTLPPVHAAVLLSKDSLKTTPANTMSWNLRSLAMVGRRDRLSGSGY